MTTRKQLLIITIICIELLGICFVLYGIGLSIGPLIYPHWKLFAGGIALVFVGLILAFLVADKSELR